MPHPLTRRALLRRGVALAAGATTVAALRPVATRAQPSVEDEDLIDAGDAFRRGVARGVRVEATADGPALRAASDGGSYTSAALRSRRPFTHVGLHWAGGGHGLENLAFELRTSGDGTAWSPWQAVHVERLPHETPTGDVFASLVAAPNARFVQYRVTFHTRGGAGPTLRRVTATVIASPVGAVGALAAATVVDDGTGRTLSVVTREQWGADEGYRVRGNRELWPEMFVPVKKLIVHHTATRNDYASATEAAAEVRAIYRYHAVTQRWGDIGYTALVDKFGTVYEGRHGRGEGGGRELLSAGFVAGHDYAHNYGSAGVALIGDATRPDWPMPTTSAAMWQGLAAYSVFEAARHDLRPLNADGSPASADFLRSDDLWADGMKSVSGHRETNATTCPGDVVMGLLPSLRDAMHAGLSGDGAMPARVEIAGLTIKGDPSATSREATWNTNLRLAFTWALRDLPAGWQLDAYEHCLEGWSKPADGEDLQYLTGYEPGIQQPRPVWTAVGSTTSLQVAPPQAGHYTLHVRARVSRSDGGGGRRAYADHRTVLVRAASTAGGRGPRR